MHYMEALCQVSLHYVLFNFDDSYFKYFVNTAFLFNVSTKYFIFFSFPIFVYWKGLATSC